MLNYLHGYKRLCCQNLAYRQAEIKWSFFVEHLNSWFAGTHENHENWYTTIKNEFTVFYFLTRIIPAKKSSRLKPLGQMNRNLVGSILGRSFIKIAN
jgi:hypothetical protein